MLDFNTDRHGSGLAAGWCWLPSEQGPADEGTAAAPPGSESKPLVLEAVETALARGRIASALPGSRLRPGPETACTAGWDSTSKRLESLRLGGLVVELPGAFLLPQFTSDQGSWGVGVEQEDGSGQVAGSQCTVSWRVAVRDVIRSDCS